MTTRSFRPLRTLATAAIAFSLLISQESAARAWGSTGHHLIARAGIDELPATVPGFLRTTDAAGTIEALGTEADRSKGSGKEHDSDWDPAHYLDLGDNGKIAGVVDLNGTLPGSERDYDTALRGASTDQYSMGYLPYSLIDGWQQVTTDFAFWRTDRVGETKAETPEDRAWFAEDRMRRETITIRDIGYWSHFVGDASQPLHVSIHYNGWGNYPNPDGFTMSGKTHSHFEGAFVRANATLALVEKAMKPVHECGCAIEQDVEHYLLATNSNVVPFYKLEKQGAFETSTPAGVDFMIARLADGADQLRDFVVEAWDASANSKIGYPEGHPVTDYESGTVVPSRVQVGGSD